MPNPTFACMTRPDIRVVVVGAGVAGLSVTATLAAEHYDEAAARLQVLLIEDNTLDARLIQIMLNEAGAGQFVLKGYAGNSAPDHVDQLTSLPEFLRWLK